MAETILQRLQQQYLDEYNKVKTKVAHGIQPTSGDMEILNQWYQQWGRMAAETGGPGSSGTLPAPTSLFLGGNASEIDMVNSIVSNAMAQASGEYGTAETQYRKILDDINAYGIKVDQIWDGLSAEVKETLAQSAQKQRAEVETGYAGAKDLLTKEIEDLTTDYQKAMGYYDNLLVTGIADPQGRIRQIRGELETNFKTYLNDVMDVASRKGVQGQTMLAGMPKTQEAFFKSMIPLVNQQQEAAYGAGERIAGAKAGLQTGLAGQRGALTGNLANLETWKGGTLANIEAAKSAGEVNLAGQVAQGKATGATGVMGKQTDVAGNILNLSAKKAALPLWGGEMLTKATTANQPVQRVGADTRLSAVPGTSVSGRTANLGKEETFQEWQNRIKKERTAGSNSASWTSFYS